MLDPRKSPSLLQLLPALLPGAAAGGALSLRLRSCTLPLHSLLVGTAPAPVRSLLLEQCRFPGGGPAVDVLLKQLPALSSLSFVSDPERDGAAQLDWVPGDITWRSGLTHLALVGQRINTLPPGRYLDRECVGGWSPACCVPHACPSPSSRLFTPSSRTALPPAHPASPSPLPAQAW